MLYDDFLKINLFYLLIFWLCWVFVAEHGLSLVAVSRGFSLLCSAGSRHTGSVVVARGLSSCGSRAVERRLSCFGTQT